MKLVKTGVGGWRPEDKEGAMVPLLQAQPSGSWTPSDLSRVPSSSKAVTVSATGFLSFRFPNS